MTEQVVALAEMLGRVTADERLRMMCRLAQERLEGMLRPGISPDECGESFPLAAALMALGMSDNTDTDGISAFTAGDVTIRRDGACPRGESLEGQALRLMRPFLQDGGFVFREVRG